MENNCPDLKKIDIREMKKICISNDSAEKFQRMFDGIIDEEMQKKTEDQDMELIEDCIKLICILKGIKYEFTEEELMKKAQQAIDIVESKLNH